MQPLNGFYVEPHNFWKVAFLMNGFRPLKCPQKPEDLYTKMLQISYTISISVQDTQPQILIIITCAPSLLFKRLELLPRNFLWSIYKNLLETNYTTNFNKVYTIKERICWHTYYVIFMNYINKNSYMYVFTEKGKLRQEQYGKVLCTFSKAPSILNTHIIALSGMCSCYFLARPHVVLASRCLDVTCQFIFKITLT